MITVSDISKYLNVNWMYRKHFTVVLLSIQIVTY